MNDEQRGALLRAQALHDEGQSWETVADILAREGVTTNRGRPYTATSMRIMSKNLSNESTGQVPAAPPVERDEPLSIDKVDRLMHSIMQRVERLIDEKIQAALGARRAVASVSREDDPPSPPKTGKRLHGEKKDLRARIDRNLMNLLEVDCQTHYSGNMSKCLDAILWRYYDKPRLSFEELEES